VSSVFPEPAVPEIKIDFNPFDFLGLLIFQTSLFAIFLKKFHIDTGKPNKISFDL
jgi:hypothetical protein